MRLEVPMGSKRFRNMSSTPIFGVQLNWGEIGDIVCSQMIRCPTVLIGLFSDVPALKNMYRIVAVFLCTLKGCPVNMILFAIMRVGSGFTNEPVATSSGARSGVNT
jgi:hypothetical protein